MIKSIYVDFDGVIHSYTSGWQGDNKAIDKPVEGAIDWLKDLIKDKELKVCIYSSRSQFIDGIETMKNYLLKYGLTKEELSQIDFPVKKGPAFITIDDRAITFKGKFPNKDVIKNFKTWNKR